MGHMFLVISLISLIAYSFIPLRKESLESINIFGSDWFSA